MLNFYQFLEKFDLTPWAKFFRENPGARQKDVQITRGMLTAGID